MIYDQDLIKILDDVATGELPPINATETIRLAENFQGTNKFKAHVNATILKELKELEAGTKKVVEAALVIQRVMLSKEINMDAYNKL